MCMRRCLITLQWSNHVGVCKGGVVPLQGDGRIEKILPGLVPTCAKHDGHTLEHSSDLHIKAGNSQCPETLGEVRVACLSMWRLSPVDHVEKIHSWMNGWDCGQSKVQSSTEGMARHKRSHGHQPTWANQVHEPRNVVCLWDCLLVGCLTSQQHASVSQGRICSDNFTCCHTEIELADPTFYLTQSQYTDTGLTSPSADPIMPGAWQGSHWSANF